MVPYQWARTRGFLFFSDWARQPDEWSIRFVNDYSSHLFKLSENKGPIFWDYINDHAGNGEPIECLAFTLSRLWSSSETMCPSFGQHVRHKFESVIEGLQTSIDGSSRQCQRGWFDSGGGHHSQERVSWVNVVCQQGDQRQQSMVWQRRISQSKVRWRCGYVSWCLCCIEKQSWALRQCTAKWQARIFSFPHDSKVKIWVHHSVFIFFSSMKRFGLSVFWTISSCISAIIANPCKVYTALL